jgi:CheY-like chemotaxis protein
MDKLPLDLHPVDPAEVIHASIDLIRPIADKKLIRIDTKTDPSVGLVSADPSRLKQVIWNLLANAIKFSSEGKQIQIRLDRIQDATIEYASIKVSDEGKGISPEFIPQLFNRFSQADSSSTRIHGGLGLGLALVRNLVELHGGTVKAESPGEGKGSTFTVNIPIILNKKDFSRDSKLSSEIKAIENNDEQIKLDGLRVLLVDDEANTSEALTVVLQSFGAEVNCAASASEALEIFQKFQPHVLVSDIAMPGEDGYSLIRKIKLLGQKGQIPSLALTAYASGEDIKRALDAGYQAHLAKPVDVNNLSRTIARLAGRTES